jgi:hypothetical protein
MNENCCYQYSRGIVEKAMVLVPVLVAGASSVFLCIEPASGTGKERRGNCSLADSVSQGKLM